MSDRNVPYPAGYPLPAFFNKNQNIETLATMHENNRQRVVTEVLMDLFLVAVKGYIPKGQTVRMIDTLMALKGAEWQSWQSTGGNQAAHCLPRQLYVGSAPFDKFLETYAPHRVAAAVILFADADDLPANYNRADSLAEGKGLAEGFRKACVSVINNAHTHGTYDEYSVIMNVKTSYKTYRAHAAEAFLQSKTHLENVLQFKTKDAKAKARREERLDIIKYYQYALAKSAGHNEKVTLEKAKSLMLIYDLK